jgi:glycosyltransferase involved in cell wall biosynthesis
VDKPLVTIIAACYRQSATLRETLDSIRAQTYPNIQLLIYDDKSPDDSVKQINQWLAETGTEAYFEHDDENLGIVGRLNGLLPRVEGKYFQLIACDDIMIPDKIEKQVALLEADPEAAMVYSDAEIIDEESRPTGDRYIGDMALTEEMLAKHGEYGTVLRSNFIPAPSVLIRTRVVKNLGGYDSTLNYEDWDMWLQIFSQHRGIFQKEPTCYYRRSGSSMWGGMRAPVFESTLDIIEKYMGRNEADDRILRHKLAYFARRYYAQHGKQACRWLAKAAIYNPGIAHRWFARACKSGIPFRISNGIYGKLGGQVLNQLPAD